MRRDILALDSNFNPYDWITWQDYITHHVKGNVLKTFGDSNGIKRGGVNRISLTRSEVEIHPIVAIKGFIKNNYKTPPLTNANLFQRDCHMCGYCGRVYRSENLSRDHIIPVSKGGPNVWKNCVTACKTCNREKGDMTIDQWDKHSQKIGLGERKLLFVPYVPSAYEKLILANRNILACQMEFLINYLPDHSRLRPTVQ
jgi:hypothetical protein